MPERDSQTARPCQCWAPVTKASKSSYRGHQRSRNGSSALRGFRKLSLNMPRHPLRSVVWDTGFVTVPRRGWPPNPAVTYPDVSGTSNKFKSFGFASRSLLVAAQGRDWRCVNFWKLWLPPPLYRFCADLLFRSYQLIWSSKRSRIAGCSFKTLISLPALGRILA
jgi:hypothetical protein